MLPGLLGAALLLAGPGVSVEPFDVKGFRTSIDVVIEAPVETVFDTATGDVSAWWDHSFVTHPAQIVIEPRPGGHFYEVFEEGTDNGAIHADIIYVNAPETLRMHGPLGLSGRSYDLVTTWTLSEGEHAGQTRFVVDLSMHGEIDEGTASVVTQVWVHFIEERLKVYIEGGCHLSDDPCAAFESAN